MSIQNALLFTRVYQKEDKLKQHLLKLNDPEKVRDYLDYLELDFNDEELEEAINIELTKVQTSEEQGALNEIKNTYLYLVSTK